MEKIRFVALIFCLSFLYAICDAQELTPVVSQFENSDIRAGLSRLGFTVSGQSAVLR